MSDAPDHERAEKLAHAAFLREYELTRKGHECLARAYIALRTQVADLTEALQRIAEEPDPGGADDEGWGKSGWVTCAWHRIKIARAALAKTSDGNWLEARLKNAYDVGYQDGCEGNAKDWSGEPETSDGNGEGDEAPGQAVGKNGTRTVPSPAPSTLERPDVEGLLALAQRCKGGEFYVRSDIGDRRGREWATKMHPSEVQALGNYILALEARAKAGAKDGAERVRNLMFEAATGDNRRAAQAEAERDALASRLREAEALLAENVDEASGTFVDESEMSDFWRDWIYRARRFLGDGSRPAIITGTQVAEYLFLRGFRHNRLATRWFGPDATAEHASIQDALEWCRQHEVPRTIMHATWLLWIGDATAARMEEIEAERAKEKSP